MSASSTTTMEPAIAETGSSLDEIPFDVINKIMLLVAAKSAIDVMKCKRV